MKDIVRTVCNGMSSVMGSKCWESFVATEHCNQSFKNKCGQNQGSEILPAGGLRDLDTAARDFPKQPAAWPPPAGSTFPG